MNSRIRGIGSLLPLLVVPLLAGCRDDGLDRIGIQGIVWYQDMPLDGADVIFRPRFGPSSGAKTDGNGNYRIDKSYGPNSGLCEVRVVKMAVPEGESFERNVLPEKFSSTPMIVEFESGQNSLDINLDEWDTASEQR